MPYRNLTPPSVEPRAHLEFVERSNERRRELNWSEATLLEAAACMGPHLDCSWKTAMLNIVQWNGWMKVGDTITMKKVLWASETESPPPWKGLPDDRSLNAVMRRLKKRLPKELERRQ